MALTRIRMFLTLILLFLCLTSWNAHGLASVEQHRRVDVGSRSERTVVILYHKPPGIVTSHKSQDERPTVYEQVQSMQGFVSSRDMANGAKSTLTFQDATGIQSKLHAIGRLDVDTSGLLLLTNDGGLVHHVTNPTGKSHSDGKSDPDSIRNYNNTMSVSVIITKTYEAVIMGHHTDDSLNAVRHGIDIGSKYGGMTQPVHDLQVLGHPTPKTTTVSISIAQGKNRQIRRMFHAMGSGVMKLQRTRIGDHLNLEGVEEEGQWRILSEKEVQASMGWKPRNLGSPVAPASQSPKHRHLGDRTDRKPSKRRRQQRKR
jgi:pseudouridine synthase